MLQRNALILGKFMPLHKGHKYLIDFALNWCLQNNTKLIVLVCWNDKEPIPGWTRHTWLYDEFSPYLRAHPNYFEIRYCDRDLPQEPEDDPEGSEHFWKQWKTTIEYFTFINRYQPGKKFDFVFSSEQYGFKLAEVLGAEHIPVNISREIVPISGTKIRNEPMKYFDYLTDAAKPYFVKRIYVCGPESTGKTTLAKELAKELKGVYVPEYGRDFYEMRNWTCDDFRYEHMVEIAKCHLASTEAATKQGKSLVFIDTDALATSLFSQIFFNKVDPIVDKIMMETKSDLTLLCNPEGTPWIKDSLRNLEDTRLTFFQRCQFYYDHIIKIPYVVINSGSHPAKFYHACMALEKALKVKV